jgi:hypothetical protein
MQRYEENDAQVGMMRRCVGIMSCGYGYWCWFDGWYVRGGGVVFAEQRVAVSASFPFLPHTHRRQSYIKFSKLVKMKEALKMLP